MPAPPSGRPGVAFSLALLATVCVALVFPDLFLNWGSFDSRRAIAPLLQFIMFTMGTRVSLPDLREVLSAPTTVALGLALQYAIIPLTGAALAAAFILSPESTAGVILTGSVCAGNSSNVMTWFAGGNLALSMTMTTFSTLLAPLATPFVMQLLAGQAVPVDFFGLSMSIVRIVFIPVLLGLACERFLRGSNALNDRWIPRLVIAATCLVNAIITANSRQALLATGLLLVAVAVLHNFAGYVLGYSAARACRLDARDASTMAMQVGIRNAGLAAGLATDVLRSAEAAVPTVLFGTVQNASGALFATYLRKRNHVGEDT
ncbi:MAG TPA: bile acid:sodium symporter family protein [Bryobacteraceae bacterium]|nr:bile acid:sodium symporter family protein [Bryobacteraceae bacterium]